MRRQTDQEKIFVDHIFDKGYIRNSYNSIRRHTTKYKNRIENWTLSGEHTIDYTDVKL